MSARAASGESESGGGSPQRGKKQSKIGARWRTVGSDSPSRRSWPRRGRPRRGGCCCGLDWFGRLEGGKGGGDWRAMSFLVFWGARERFKIGPQNTRVLFRRRGRQQEGDHRRPWHVPGGRADGAARRGGVKHPVLFCLLFSLAVFLAVSRSLDSDFDEEMGFGRDLFDKRWCSIGRGGAGRFLRGCGGRRAAPPSSVRPTLARSTTPLSFSIPPPSRD